MVRLRPSRRAGAAEPQVDLRHLCMPRAANIDLKRCGCRQRTVLGRDLHAQVCSLITRGYALEISAVSCNFGEPSALMAPALLCEVLQTDSIFRLVTAAREQRHGNAHPSEAKGPGVIAGFSGCIRHIGRPRTSMMQSILDSGCR